jgi:hypothetical protein
MLLRMTLPSRGTKLLAELRDGAKLLFADKIDPLSARAVAKLLGELARRGYQLTSEQVLGLREGGELELTPMVNAAAAEDDIAKVHIVRRKRQQPASAGVVFTSLNEALIGGADDDELEWDDIEQLAVLDVDYHGLPFDGRPQEFQLVALALVIRPRPIMFWISRGRGLHLVYQPVGGLTAEEAAACGGLHVKQLDPKCTFEILARTSYPPNREVWS